MTRLSGKVAVVTGAASGIGATTAELLASEGASVVLADIDADAAEELAATIRDRGYDAIAVAFDLGDERSISSLIEQTVAITGGIDVLHNNAAATALASTRDLLIADTGVDVWDDTLRINARGTLLAIKAVVPHMLARGGGSIINTSSGASLAGDLGHCAYGASKAAINAITMYAATEYGKQSIRVNAVAPGLIVTPASQSSGHSEAMATIMLDNHLTPRLGEPMDVAYAVLYLASDESSFVTGQIISVDGGLSAHQPYFSELLAQAREG